MYDININEHISTGLLNVPTLYTYSQDVIILEVLVWRSLSDSFAQKELKQVALNNH